MKFRTAVRRSTVILFILAASVFLGYAYQIFGDYLEKRDNPRTYADYVSRYCEEYGLPDEVILHPKAPYTKRLISDVPKIHEPWDLSTVG